MKRLCYLVLLLLTMALWTGCDNATTTAANSTAQDDNAMPTKAQPRLATIKLWVGPEEMTAEMALTPIQEKTGMMFRTNMAENDGMIFVLGGPQQANFWMTNCPMPLSAAYMDTDGKILEIHDFEPFNTNGVLSKTFNIQFVLETRQGWFERHHVKEGAIIASEKGSLKKTFLGQ